MEEKAQKPRSFGKIKVLLLVGVLIYVIITFVNQQSTLTVQRQRQEDLAVREAGLERELEYKQNELDFIGTDEYVEQEVRKRLGWLKPDEIKYVEGTGATPPPAAQPEASASALPSYPQTEVPEPTPQPTETPLSE